MYFVSIEISKKIQWTGNERENKLTRTNQNFYDQTTGNAGSTLNVDKHEPLEREMQYSERGNISGVPKYFDLHYSSHFHVWFHPLHIHYLC